MQPSDPPYKVLFLDPGLFEEAVRLVAPELADALDFATAASLDKEHLTAATRSRLQDQLRRVEFKEGALKDGRRPYVLVLLEFQSDQDQDMAWRMREYLHLVESDLREAGALEREGALPPMLSIVVHNGERPWRAGAEHRGPLTGDGRQAPMRMYATVDLPVLARGPDAEGRALAPGSRLAELEYAPAEAWRGLLWAAFRRHGGAGSAGLRRGLHLRVEAVLARQGMAAELPPLAEFERRLAERRGGDMTAMMDLTLERWVKAKIAEGLEQGLEQGLAQGVEQGLAQGTERGLAQGMEQGLEQGRAQGMERGLAQGRVALLGRQAEHRFGAGVAGQLTTLLADVSDLSRLDEAGEWLMECDTGEALLERLQAAGRGTRNSATG